MAQKATLITSRSKKGLQAVRFFEDAYNKAHLDGGRAQMLNEKGGEFQEGILALITKLAPLPEKPHILVIDRSVAFDPLKVMGSGWTMWRGAVDGKGLEGEIDQDERMLAVTEIDPRNMVFSHHLKPGESSVVCEEKLLREKQSGVLRLDPQALIAMVNEPGQKTLKIFQAMGITWFEALGGVLRSPRGIRCALYAYAGGGRWHWDYYWLDPRNRYNPSASLGK